MKILDDKTLIASSLRLSLLELPESSTLAGVPPQLPSFHCSSSSDAFQARIRTAPRAATKIRRTFTQLDVPDGVDDAVVHQAAFNVMKFRRELEQVALEIVLKLQRKRNVDQDRRRQRRSRRVQLDLRNQNLVGQQAALVQKLIIGIRRLRRQFRQKSEERCQDVQVVGRPREDRQALRPQKSPNSDHHQQLSDGVEGGEVAEVAGGLVGVEESSAFGKFRQNVQRKVSDELNELLERLQRRRFHREVFRFEVQQNLVDIGQTRLGEVHREILRRSVLRRHQVGGSQQGFERGGD